MEVDFVVYGACGLIAVEVKNADRIRPEDFRGLKGFAEDYPENRRILLYRGKERLLRGGVPVMPAAEFVPALRPNQFPE